MHAFVRVCAYVARWHVRLRQWGNKEINKRRHNNSRMKMTLFFQLKQLSFVVPKPIYFIMASFFY
jgi:hypothetical protein